MFPAMTPEAPPEVKERHQKAAKASGGGAGAIGDFLNSTTGRSMESEVVRRLFGLLKKNL